MRRKPSGRLELTWMGKDSALIPVEDGKYDYDWVSPDDPRVREVRTIEVDEIVGEADGATGANENLLIIGEAADALRSLGSIPEYAEKYLGKVKLVYIDPPFNTEQAFEHYADQLEHSVWLTMMRDRIRLIKPLMASDASIWVHLDDREVHRMRVLLDEEFGINSHIATISWEKVAGRDNRTAMSKSCDFILVYAPMGREWMNVRNLVERSTDQVASMYSNPDDDPRGVWTSDNFTAKAGVGRRASQFYDLVTPNGQVFVPPTGACWRFTHDRYEELLRDDRVYFGSDGNQGPRLKRFLSEVQSGLVPKTLWRVEEVGSNDSAKKEIKTLFPGTTPFDTPKPERLLQRVIEIGSNKGDLVLDCFAGSGTTPAVAQKLNRRWVAIELQERTAQGFTVPRLVKVIDGKDTGGVSSSKERLPIGKLPDGLTPAEAQQFNSLLSKVIKDTRVLADPENTRRLRAATRTKEVTTTNWLSGGGFTVAHMGPSMYEVNDELGMTFLSEAATNGPWSKSVAGQLGFKLFDHPVFIGQKGRQRLAVIDGVIDEQVIRTIVTNLEASERAVIVGKSALTGTDQLLTSLSKGSRLHVAPDDLFPKGTVA